MDIQQLVGLVMKLFAGNANGAAAPGAGALDGLLATAKEALKGVLSQKLAPEQSRQLDRVENNTASAAEHGELRGALGELFAKQPELAKQAEGLLGPLSKMGDLGALLGGGGGGDGDGKSPLGGLGDLLGGLFK